MVSFVSLCNALLTAPVHKGYKHFEEGHFKFEFDLCH